jgi:hypothetical protein
MGRGNLDDRCGRSPLLLLALVLSMPAFPAGTAAQTGERFSVTWSTVDAGGGTSASGGGRYSVSGTAGQPDAGTHASADGRYELAGGFWSLSIVTVPAVTLLTLLALCTLLARSGSWRLRPRRTV